MADGQVHMLQVANVSKIYRRRGRAAGEPFKALSDVSFDASEGEFVTIIGPSGCGKSTLLKLIAGLEDFDDGQIMLGGQPIDGPSPASSVVFQQASLLPWRNVLHNVEYGLRLRFRGRLKPDDRKARSLQALELVGLTDFAGHYPHELSGGMQQRVNLARALAVQPRLLLMDEPFGALDAITRETLQGELTRIAHASARTTIFVTHDVEEAVFLGDRVMVMGTNPGRIVEMAGVDLKRPRDRSVIETTGFQQIARELRQMLSLEHPSSSGISEERQRTNA